MTAVSEKCKVIKKRKTLQERKTEIFHAAIELLCEQGFDRTTMSAIAARVKMSKETLYRVYPSKELLFADLVGHNASKINQELEEALKGLNGEKNLVPDTLTSFGEKLLSLLTSTESLVLNRVAISTFPLNDEFALMLSEKGRGTTLPLLKKMMDRAAQRGELPLELPENAPEILLGLLLGDLQIRCLLGVSEAPDKTVIQRQAQKAVEYFVVLMQALITKATG